MKKKFLIVSIVCFVSLISKAQISITSLPYTPATTSFDSYDPSSAANMSTLPAGWTAASAGTAAYKSLGTGTSANGGYWAFGTGGEFSLGALRSGTTDEITYTLSFTNNTGSTIQSLTISWDYEQWRFVNTSGFDCSGTGQLAGNTTLNGKDFAGTNSGTSGTVAVTAVNAFNLTGLNITNGQSFGIQWVTTDQTGSDNGIAIDNFSISATSGAPLPLNLLSFSAQQAGAVDQLAWAVDCQSTVSKFKLEHSDGHREFETVTQLDAQKDNCIGKQHYRVEHPINAAPLRLYRLAMEEASGLISYSNILRVAGTMPHSGISLFPLPAKDRLYAGGAEPGSPWQIMNLQGQSVKSGVFSPDAIDIADLTEGHYLLRHSAGSLRFEKR
ncbi:MAG: hypothetical protein JST06_10340 [Bacteroidetes bacterium]|nr:hypothetical protein [Bacteroidota bacterium]MBS1630133.1 hypothetical protein [Bacteroidota bacterium]